MNRKIIAYENYYQNFFDTLDKGTQEKVLYGLLLLKTQDREIDKALKLKKEYYERKRIKAELAEKIGTNKSYTSRGETGKTEPKVSLFIALLQH